jgi:RHS repeat-associated protein
VAGDASVSIFGYQSDPVDADTGAVDMGTRLYDANQGRFTTKDTLSGDPTHPLSLNQFIYGMGNPTSMWDPNGMCPGNILSPDCSYGGKYNSNIHDNDRKHTETQRQADEIYSRWHYWSHLGSINVDPTPPPPPAPPKPHGFFGFIHSAAHAVAAAGHWARQHAVQIAAVAATVAAIVLTAGVLAGVAMAVGSALLAGDMAGAALAIGGMTAGEIGAVAVDGAAESELSGTALARQLGAEGESLIEGAGNTARIQLPGGGYRIPDILDEAGGVIGEVKNVQSLSFTSQLRDYVGYAQRNGFQFDVYVRGSTRLSGPLQRAIDNGIINMFRALP